MNISIICVGRLKEKYWVDACREYSKRLNGICGFSIIEVDEERIADSPNEANIREGKISIKSPIAQALLNKKVGDVVEVRVPAGTLKLRIESIQQ